MGRRGLEGVGGGDGGSERRGETREMTRTEVLSRQDDGNRSLNALPYWCFEKLLAG